METRPLKQAGVCRIFFSSPFKGMEGEREEFTRRYWPQIDSYCKSKGVQFVPVDMRWGITTELSDNNQTINICLREIDRSDMFIGFFGQRYGWHGEKDEQLQKNFDAAIPSFPWIDQYRNKSVTELEFLHGHLNNPGKLPAVMCFRDKAYDDAQRADAEAKADRRTVINFSTESDLATQLMDDLKDRVKATESKCLGVDMCYNTPEEGAKFMFDKMWAYLTEKLLKGDDKRSVLEQHTSDHVMYRDTMTTSYVTDESLLARVSSFVSQDTGSRMMVITGEGGSGKTALMANWVHKLEEQGTDTTLVYHFVGCSAESARSANILLRVVSSLHFGLDSDSQPDKSAFWSDLHSRYQSLEESQLAHTWQRLMQRYEEKNGKVVIVVAGLDKINYGGFEKVVQPLFWLPSTMSRGCFLILSTNVADTKHLTILKTKTELSEMQMAPLTLHQQHEMCKGALALRGKELSPRQLDVVVKATGTSNPLFLNVVLEELCMFGKFRELDAKIESLVTCENSIALFDKYLERLEHDYNSHDYDGNLVEQVVCALCVSRIGLQETELIEMLEIPQNLWPPLFYGLEKYMISRQGFLRIAHDELENAIYDRYIKVDEVKKLHLEKQVRYYLKSLEKYFGVTLPSEFHVLKELLWTAYSCDDRLTVLKVITTPVYLKYLVVNNLQAYLFEYVQWLDYDQDSLVNLYHRTFSRYMAKDYGDQQDEDLIQHPNVAVQLLDNLWTFQTFLRFCHYLKAQKRNLYRIKGVVENNTRMDPEERIQHRLDVCMRLAQVYQENRDTEEAIKANQDFLDLLEEQYKDKEVPSNILATRAIVYHGLGLVNMQLENLDLAEEYIGKSIDNHRQYPTTTDEENIKQSRKLLAEIKFKRGLVRESAELYEDIVKEEERLAAGTLSIEMSYSYTFLGICYRKLDQFDTAKARLDKAMEIKKTVLGEKHRDVAIGYFNNANLAKDMDNLEGMVENLNKAIEIHKYLGEDPLNSHNMFVAFDNLIMACVFLHRWEDAHDTYFSMFEAIEAKFELALSFNHENVMRYCWRNQKYEEAFKILRLLVTSRHVQPDHFVFLHLLRCEKLIPAEQFNPTMFIDTGIQRFPGNEELLLTKVELDLVPAKDLAAINRHIEEYLLHVTEERDKIVCLSATKCSDRGWSEGAVGLYEYWRTKLPNPEAIVRNLAVLYYETKELEKCGDCFKEATELNPDLWILQDKLVLVLLLQGRVGKAETELERLQQKFGSQPEVPDKVEVYKKQIQEIQEYQSKQGEECTD